MNALVLVTKHAVMITAFVSVMMLVIEYVNVLTQGQWQERLSRRHWGQYALAAFLGATPGCLGAFAVVAMYSHRNLSLGAVVADSVYSLQELEIADASFRQKAVACEKTPTLVDGEQNVITAKVEILNAAFE